MYVFLKISYKNKNIKKYGFKMNMIKLDQDKIFRLTHKWLNLLGLK